MNDLVLQELTKTCEFLTSLDISKCPGLTDKGISFFIQEKPQLISLNLENNFPEYITDQALAGLKHCVNLEHLNIN